MTIDVDHLPCGCLITSPNQEVLKVNQCLLDSLDRQSEALIGQNMNMVMDKATQLFCESFVIPMVFREGICREVLVSLKSPDGKTFPKVANVSKMPDGTLAWVFIEAANREKLFKELETARLAVQDKREQLEMLARTDDLTGLANRRDLEIRAHRVFLDAERSGGAVSVVILDIDCFKTVNDTHGHGVGDQVLCAFADVLKSTCRESDIVARMGGDEFVCVLNNCGSSDARVLCERIHQAVARTLLDTCQFTVSIGLAVKPHDTQMEFSEVLKLADRCLYIVKKNGRNASFMMTASAA